MKIPAIQDARESFKVEMGRRGISYQFEVDEKLVEFATSPPPFPDEDHVDTPLLPHTSHK